MEGCIGGGGGDTEALVVGGDVVKGVNGGSIGIVGEAVGSARVYSRTSSSGCIIAADEIT